LRGDVLREERLQKQVMCQTDAEQVFYALCCTANTVSGAQKNSAGLHNEPF